MTRHPSAAALSAVLSVLLSTTRISSGFATALILLTTELIDSSSLRVIITTDSAKGFVNWQVLALFSHHKSVLEVK